MDRKEVILVDEDDRETGTADKVVAHEQGWLHRAVSVMVLNGKGEVLLQRRADGKYHSAGLWSNACCTHPQPGEDVAVAAHSRLMEEMGFECELKFVGKFRYRAVFENQMIEHEVDHVFSGRYTGEVYPNADEVAAYQWIAPEVLEQELAHTPEKYSYWLPQVMGMVRGMGFRE